VVHSGAFWRQIYGSPVFGRSGFFDCRPDGLELVTRRTLSSMRYINPRFTYLLTYIREQLLCQHCGRPRQAAGPHWSPEQAATRNPHDSKFTENKCGAMPPCRDATVQQSRNVGRAVFRCVHDNNKKRS